MVEIDPRVSVGRHTYGQNARTFLLWGKTERIELGAFCSIAADQLPPAEDPHMTMDYQHFQLINGREIGRSIARRMINRIAGEPVPYLFPRHAAGPFGGDLDGRWLAAEAAMLQRIGRRAFYGRGWIDVHARAA